MAVPLAYLPPGVSAGRGDRVQEDKRRSEEWTGAADGVLRESNLRQSVASRASTRYEGAEDEDDESRSPHESLGSQKVCSLP